MPEKVKPPAMRVDIYLRRLHFQNRKSEKDEKICRRLPKMIGIFSRFLSRSGGVEQRVSKNVEGRPFDKKSQNNSIK